MSTQCRHIVRPSALLQAALRKPNPNPLVTPTLGTFTPRLSFLSLSVFELRARTAGRTDGRTGKTRIAADQNGRLRI